MLCCTPFWPLLNKNTSRKRPSVALEIELLSTMERRGERSVQNLCLNKEIFLYKNRDLLCCLLRCVALYGGLSHLEHALWQLFLSFILITKSGALAKEKKILFILCSMLML